MNASPFLLLFNLFCKHPFPLAGCMAFRGCQRDQQISWLWRGHMLLASVLFSGFWAGGNPEPLWPGGSQLTSVLLLWGQAARVQPALACQLSRREPGGSLLQCELPLSHLSSEKKLCLPMRLNLHCLSVPAPLFPIILPPPPFFQTALLFCSLLPRRSASHLIFCGFPAALREYLHCLTSEGFRMGKTEVLKY